MMRARPLTVLPAIVALTCLTFASEATAQPLTVGSYEKINERRVTRTVTEFTYRASLTNTGPDVPGATATLTSLSAATTIVQGTLTFGPAASNATVPSLDTFTFRHDRAVPFDWSMLQWTVTAGSTNAPPVAHAGSDQTVAVGATVSVDGSGSTDADGDALTFAWALESAPTGSAAALSDAAAVNPSFVADVSGTYVLRLVVNDGTLDSAPDIVAITTGNSAPVADAGPDQTTAIGELVTLDGNGSADADGDPLTYAWSFVSRPASSLATLNDPASSTPTFVVDSAGSYVVRLVVHDGATASAADTVTITTGNSRPVADAGPDQSVFEAASVTLDGTGSSDADGDSLAFSWSFTTIPVGSAATLSDPANPAPSFVPDLPGIYVAQLIVGDGFDSSEPDTVTVTVGLPEVTLQATDPAAAEAGRDTATFTFSRTGPTSAPLTIAFSIEGTAINGTDYDTIGASITIPAGAASADLVIGPLDDDVFELPESVLLTLGSHSTYTVGTTHPVAATITDNDALVSVVTADRNAAEDGPDPGSFTVSRLGPTDEPLVVFYAMTDAAANGADYLALGGSVTIPAGSPSATVTVVPIDDDLVEGPEDATLVITEHPSYTIGALRQATVTIFDDELPVVTLRASDEDAAEAGPDAGTFLITRTGPTSAPLTVNVNVLGAAVNGVDYETIASTATIPAGSDSTSITIMPIDDTEFEGTELVILSLAAAPGYVAGIPGIGAVVIVDNDGARVTIAATDPVASESGDTGTFTVTRTGGDLTQALLVLVSRSGTATNGLDYASIGGASFFVTIPANEPTATVTITPLADTVVEGDETVTLTISPRAEYVVDLPGSATVTIVSGANES